MTAKSETGVISSNGSTATSYPKGVYFCLLNEAAERFVMYGILAILTFYLMSIFGMSSSGAMIAFHAFASLAFVTAIFGSIWADGFFGAYKVVLLGTVLYIIGSIFLTASTFNLETVFGEQGQKWFGVIGLGILALGAGARKPCLAAFAADQFPVEMVQQRKQFFSIIYIVTYASAILAQISAPLFRGGVPCMGEDTCYPLAFGVLTIVIILSLGIILAGNYAYKKSHVTSNVVAEACKCIFHAIRQKLNPDLDEKHDHWLDRAIPDYSQAFVNEIKGALKVCWVLAPTIIPWAMIFQNGSSFVVQGSWMNCRVGQLTILPDQLVTSSSIFVVVLIVLLEWCIYPVLARRNWLQSPLQRIGLGCILAIGAFAWAGFIQLELDKEFDEPAPHNFSKLTIVNRANCTVELEQERGFKVLVDQHLVENLIVPKSRLSHKYSFDNCSQDVVADLKFRAHRDMQDRPVNFDSELLVFWSTSLLNRHSTLFYDVNKPENGNSRFYIVLSPTLMENIVATTDKHYPKIQFDYEDDGRPIFSLPLNRNQTFLDVKPALIGADMVNVWLHLCPNETICPNRFLGQFKTSSGLSMALLIDETFQVQPITLLEPNQLSVLWQIPQYCLILASDMFLSTGGVEFAYTQASTNMKSVLQAYRLVTLAIGNLVYMGVAATGLVTEPASVFFFWTATMALTMLWYVLVSYKYKFLEEGDNRDESVKSEETGAAETTSTHC